MKNPFLNDRFILTLILINAVVMFLQCYDALAAFVTWLDTVLILAFLVELVCKIRHYSFRGYWSDGWNRFDMVVTLVSSISLLQFVATTGTWYSLEFLITLRVFRVFRFFRVLRFIPSIQSIMAGTRRAVVSSYVIVFAFLVTIFVVAILSCNLYRSVAPDYFGDPIHSFYTTFRLFTIEGWYEIPDRISSRCSTDFYATATRFYFGFILFFGGIIGMSFINSIIVDAMVSDNNDQVLERVRVIEGKIDVLLKNCGLDPEQVAAQIREEKEEETEEETQNG